MPNQARISKRLVTLDQHVDLDTPIDDLLVHEPDYKNLIAFLKAMEFSTLTRRVAEAADIDASQIEADAKIEFRQVAHSTAGAKRHRSGSKAAKDRRCIPAMLPLSGGGKTSDVAGDADFARSSAGGAGPRAFRSTVPNTKWCAISHG